MPYYLLTTNNKDQALEVRFKNRRLKQLPPWSLYFLFCPVSFVEWKTISEMMMLIFIKDANFTRSDLQKGSSKRLKIHSNTKSRNYKNTKHGS